MNEPIVGLENKNHFDYVKFLPSSSLQSKDNKSLSIAFVALEQQRQWTHVHVFSPGSKSQ